MMRIWLAAIALLLAGFGAGATAAADDNALRCAANQNQAVTAEQKIAACSALIASGSAQGEDLGLLYTQRGDGNYFAGKYDAAVSDYNAAMAFYTGDNSFSGMAASLVERRGDAYGAAGRNMPALGDFDRVLAAYPQQASARFGRGQALGRLGYSFNAREELDQVITLQPNRLESYIARSATSLSVSDIPHAIQDLDYALLLAPHNPGAYYNRGLAYFAAGQFDLSIHDFEQALSLTPGDPFPGEITRDQLNHALERSRAESAAWNARANAGPATMPPQTDSSVVPSRAVGRTHDCASRYPDISRMLWEEGDVLVSYDVDDKGAISNVTLLKGSGSERLDRAALSCVSALWRNTPATRDGVSIATPGHQAIVQFRITSQPKSAQDFDTQGRARACVGDFDRAMQDFDHAVELDPKSAEAYYHRGFLEYMRGNSASAISDFDIALKLKPENRDIQDARDLARAEALHATPGHAI